jgi:hypothetical protein
MNRKGITDIKHENMKLSQPMMKACDASVEDQATQISDSPLTLIETVGPITVSQPFSAMITVCDELALDMTVQLDARMQTHGHAMNYLPELTVLEKNDQYLKVRADGLVLHMPGSWEWIINLKSPDFKQSITHVFTLQ